MAEAIPLSSNIHHFLPIKLSPTNYLLWRSQFMPLLKGHNLMGFIDGTNPCPPIFVSAAKDDGSKSKEDDSPSLNPDYVSWSRQDQLLLSWILSSLTEGVHAQVVGLSTSYEVWHHLATTYASTSKARIMQLRLQLHQLKKGADTMSEFLLKAKSIADQLAMALKPIDDDDLVLYILGGLGSEYGPFVTSTTTREAHIRLSDLHGLLLSEEIRVNGSQNDLQNITANVAAKSSSSSNRGKGDYRGRGRGRGGNPSRGRGQSNNRHIASNEQPGPSNNRPTCQVCNRVGHTAIQCYQRFNHAYVSSNATPNAHYAAQTYSSDFLVS